MPHPHLELTRTLPFHQHLGIRFVQTEGGKCVLELPVTDATANPMKVMHGGIVYAVCDIAAYAALVTLLDDNQGAVTHDIHVSCMRPAPFGSTLRVTAEVVQKGKTLAFMNAEARVGDKLIATARITKSLVSAP